MRAQPPEKEKTEWTPVGNGGDRTPTTAADTITGIFIINGFGVYATLSPPSSTGLVYSFIPTGGSVPLLAAERLRKRPPPPAKNLTALRAQNIRLDTCLVNRCLWGRIIERRKPRSLIDGVAGSLIDGVAESLIEQSEV